MDSLNIQIDKNNVEQQKAFDLVANTNTCLFITGKAGTGKTTFIKRIQEEIISQQGQALLCFNEGIMQLHRTLGLHDQCDRRWMSPSSSDSPTGQRNKGVPDRQSRKGWRATGCSQCRCR